ncbi:Kelch-like protein 20 [Hypsibius exemplaris]|uniref:Kelch-like protein 20 n=1 Tax=Hypsibius exemplaris TaxID=2072580 RepID=A0A1W0WH89_HYPEX|nr:Kelch-like protein 20 [Hypsibius exemplaris]
MASGLDGDMKKSGGNNNIEASFCSNSRLHSAAATASTNPDEVSFSYTNSQHPKALLQGLQFLRQSDTFCDVILKGQEPSESFPCHRLVLSACSPFFRAMFTSNLAESRKDTVPLPNIAPATLKDLLDYMYTSEMCIEQKNVQSLLAAATFLDITPVRDACCSFMERNMDESNCLMIHCFAEMHSCTSLAEKAKTFALQRFPSVSRCSEFLDMASDKVIDLIESDDLYVEHEETVFDAAVRWLDHGGIDSAARRAQFHEILKHVRLPLLSPYFLEDFVVHLPAIQQDAGAQELLSEARYYHELPNRRAEWTSPRCRLRKSSGFAEVIVCVGGEDDKVVLRSVECFNPITASWSHLKSLPFAVSKAGVVITGDNFMYLCGGEYPDGSATRSVFRYDPVLDEWREMAPLHTARSEIGVALVDDFIYAVGGTDRARPLETVEKFDPKTNKWQNVASLRVSISCASVVALKSFLYVFGGVTDGNSDSTNYAFRYDPKLDHWADLARMPTPRSGCASCVGPSGRIFVVGGLVSSQETLCRVDVYDPCLNTWSTVADMLNRRYRPGIAILDSRIFVLGGETYPDVHSNEIESYDEERNVWESHKSELPCSRSWLSCAVMRVKKGDPADAPPHRQQSRDGRVGWMRP